MKCPHCDSDKIKFAGETTGEPGWWCEQCGTLFYQWEEDTKSKETFVPLDSTFLDGE